MSYANWRLSVDYDALEREVWRAKGVELAVLGSVGDLA